MKIYVDNQLAAKLQRMNEYIVRLKTVFTHHVHIYRSIKINFIRHQKTNLNKKDFFIGQNSNPDILKLNLLALIRGIYPMH